MKYIVSIALGLLFIACNDTTKHFENTPITNEIPTKKDSKVETLKTVQLDWLLGNWARTNDEKGQTTFESWHKVKDSLYKGVGFTLQNSDTIFKENMTLTAEGGHWNLSVSLEGEAEPTIFKVILAEPNRIVCENNNIDFPNKIEYWMHDHKLYAKVYNTQKVLNFEFKKIN